MGWTFPPRFQHDDYDEDLYEWTERGVESPHEVSWSRVFYTCKFCPGRGDEPEDADPILRLVHRALGPSEVVGEAYEVAQAETMLDPDDD